MFKKLVKMLFPSANKGDKQNFYYFEESRTIQAQAQEKSVAELQTALASKPIDLYSTEEKYQKLFYDFLFGQSPPTEKYDELSLYIANKVEKLLSNPKHILESLPAIPPSLAKVLEQLNNQDFDADVLVALIEQEPIIAAKVVELANSSFYNRSNKEVSDLKTAFMLLGINGLMEGIINGFVSKLAPQTLIYFKQYGTKIWQHSLATGVISKTLISNSPYKSESAQGYLIGLICNLGDMIIYQLLIESFSFVNPDCQPNSFAFKDLMFKNSKKITYFVAKHWNFPSSILDALALQAKLTKSSMLSPLFNKRPVACYIYEANFVSEIEMMFQQQAINSDDIHEVINSIVFSHEAKNYLTDLLNSENLEKV